MSDSSLPQGLQPIRLLHPWDFPGKSTGVGCHCLLHLLPTPLDFRCGFVELQSKSWTTVAIWWPRGKMIPICWGWQNRMMERILGIAKFNMLLNQPWNFLPLESLISDKINCPSCQSGFLVTYSQNIHSKFSFWTFKDASVHLHVQSQLLSGVHCHVHVFSTSSHAFVYFTAWYCIEYSSTLFQIQNVWTQV